MSKYSNIIEEIHAQYVDSSDQLQVQLATLEEEGGREAALEQEKDVKELASLGFDNFANAKTSLNVDERIEQMQASVADHDKYGLKYPLYKFITETAVNRINEKYKLRFGRATSFIGEIPAKNMKEILQASKAIKKTDRAGLTSLEWRLVDNADNVIETIEISLEEIKATMTAKQAKGALGRLREGMASTMGIKTPTMAETWKENKHLEANKWLLVRDGTTIEGTIAARGVWEGMMEKSMKNLVQTVGNKFLGEFVFITAPLDEFEGPSSAVVSDLEVSDTAIDILPDPIVLFEVKTTSKERGFLIASAWGDEASDEEVVNAKFN